MRRWQRETPVVRRYNRDPNALTSSRTRFELTEP